ncbi:hypothetical protein DL764_002106 [Monosporascus ibericus]|uniref:chitinase n=1 Tax=Monosporascus ibericus TaxID=155417 RepID=A0A4Q4TRP3_9PEZI|nr:hypothetical protein DL764_002106 [Monosporascus ibericus]
MTRLFGFLVGSLALYDVVLGVFSAASKNNVVLYYAETYAGPGYGGQSKPTNNRLLKCSNLQRDMYTCRQTSTKKILLSLGGGTTAYQLRGAVDRENLAKQLWYMFRPRQGNRVKQGLPRPFDYAGSNAGFSVDGFDLDIEHPPTDGSAGYTALATKLRSLYAAVPGTFYLTASPQCVVPDASMADTLRATSFDMYVLGGAFGATGFTYDAWITIVAGTYSRNARVNLGLPGSAKVASPWFELTVRQTANLANAYYCRSNFGGVTIWEATYASENVASGRNFYQNVKTALNTASTNKRLSCLPR